MLILWQENRRKNMIAHVTSGANMKYYILLETRNQFKHKKNPFFPRSVPVDLLAWKLTIPVLYLYNVIYCSEVRHHLDFLCPAVVSWYCHSFLWTLTLTGKAVVHCPLFTGYKCLLGSSLAAISRLWGRLKMQIEHPNIPLWARQTFLVLVVFILSVFCRIS